MRRIPCERRPPDEHFVREYAERVHIHPMVDVRIRHDLLWSHVGGRAKRHARGSDARLARRGRCAHRPRHAEIRHDGVPPHEQHVVGFDVPVHDPLLVRVRQCVAHIAQDGDGVGDRQSAFAVEPIAQRMPGLVGHDVIQDPSDIPRVVERHDVRMVESSHDLDLAEKTLPSEGGRDLGVHHLHCHVPPVLHVAGEIHDGHAAASELPGNPVPVAERRDDALLLYRIGT